MFFSKILATCLGKKLSAHLRLHLLQLSEYGVQATSNCSLRVHLAKETAENSAEPRIRLGLARGSVW